MSLDQDKETAAMDPKNPGTPDGLEQMRRLASRMAWNETLGRVETLISPLNVGGTRVPFYCVHSLSGKATDYVHLARLLGPDQPFFAFQIPTRLRNAELGGAVTPVSLEAIASHYTAALAAFQPTGPLALGGWSVGAVLALEMAQRLRAQGRIVTLLVSFDMSPWNTGTLTSSAAPISRMSLAANAPSWIRHHQVWKKFSFRALKERAAKKAASVMGAPQSGPRFVVGDFLDEAKYGADHLALAQAVLDLMLDYAPRPYDGDVQVYAATTEVAFRHFPRMKAEWRTIAPRAKVMRADGSHRGIIDGPQAIALVQHLKKRLGESGAARAPLGTI